MRALKLRVKNTKPTVYSRFDDRDLLYRIEEHPNGTLWWGFNGSAKDRVKDPDAIVLTRANACAWTEVTPEDAEEITNLHMPAAMDRLRELVHESGAV